MRIDILKGNFILSETEDENQLHFYRENGEILEGNVNDFEEKVCELYQFYMLCKIATNKVTDRFHYKFTLEMSEDNTCIRLTFSDIRKKWSNILKCLVKRIFGNET